MKLLHMSMILVVLAIALVGGLVVARASSSPQDHEVRFIIPAGASRREASGEQIIMLPKTITLTLGLRDTLIVRNEDDFATRISGFKLSPGQQFVQRFRRVGSYEFVCATLFHTDQFTIVVVDWRTAAEQLIDGLFR